MRALESGFTLNGIRAGADLPKIGTTTSAGAGDGTTIIDANALTEATANQWKDQEVMILSGANRGLSRPITAFDPATDKLTVAPGFPAQVASGVKYVIVASAVGAVYNKAQEVLDKVNALAGGVAYSIVKSEPGAVDEDGGRVFASATLVDLKGKRVFPLADIDISAATITLQRSTADGALSNPATQPALGKIAGAIRVENGASSPGFALPAAEWEPGDVGVITVSGVQVTDVDGDVTPIGDVIWTFEVRTTLDIDTLVRDLDTDVGEPSDAATDPSAASGTLFSKIRGAGVDLDAIIAYVDELEARLTAARALALDELTADRMSELDAGTTGKLANEVDILKEEAVIRRGTAQAGAAGTITLDAGASATNDLYNGLIVAIVSGVGAGQRRLIVDYVGSTKVATVNKAWATNPDPTSVFILGGLAASSGDLDPVVDATLALPNNTTETDVVDVTPAAGALHEVEVRLNLKNAAQAKTIRVYEHVYNGATTEFQVTDTRNWTTADDDGVRIAFTAINRWKVTIQNVVAEGIDVYHTRRVNVRH